MRVKLSKEFKHKDVTFRLIKLKLFGQVCYRFEVWGMFNEFRFNTQADAYNAAILDINVRFANDRDWFSKLSHGSYSK